MLCSDPASVLFKDPSLYEDRMRPWATETGLR